MIIRFALLFWLSLILVTPAVAGGKYSEEVSYAVEQLKVLRGIDGQPEVGGSAVGYAGEPHPTYLLGEYIRRMGNLEDFKLMLKDSNPAVRIVGAYSLITYKGFLFLEEEINEHIKEGVNYEDFWPREMQLRKEYLKKFQEDKKAIVVGPGGCSFKKTTVGKVIRELINNPEYFE